MDNTMDLDNIAQKKATSDEKTDISETKRPRVSSTATYDSRNFDITQNNRDKLVQETKLLRDTLDLLWNRSMEQRKINNDIRQENEYLQDYINSLMSSSHVLEK